MACQMIRMRFVIFIGLFYLLNISISLAQNAARQNKSSPQKGAEPHPWLANAPGEFVRLIEKGNVRIQVDDDRIRRSGKAALTHFQFSIDFDFKYRPEWIPSTAQSGVWKAKITAWLDQPKINPEHIIYVPSTFRPEDPWRSRLLKHEFDHVAVSSDPRLVKIIQRILQRRKTWIESFEQPTRPTDSEIRERIRQDVERTVKSCELMIQSKYDELDKQSTDGLTALPDRMDFFVDLYSVEGLARSQFEHLDLVKSFVADRLSGDAAIKEIENHYLFLR